MNKPLKECLDELRLILGENLQKGIGTGRAAWGGFFVAQPGQEVTTTSAAPGFPFRTASAAAVWKAINEIITKGTKGMTYTDILKKGFEVSGVPGYEITPEDAHLLDMAIHWAVTGKKSDEPAGTQTGFGRTGVGGPFRAQWFGHYLKPRGAP